MINVPITTRLSSFSPSAIRSATVSNRLSFFLPITMVNGDFIGSVSTCTGLPTSIYTERRLRTASPTREYVIAFSTCKPAQCLWVVRIGNLTSRFAIERGRTLHVGLADAISRKWRNFCLGCEIQTFAGKQSGGKTNSQRENTNEILTFITI